MVSHCKCVYFCTFRYIGYFTYHRMHIILPIVIHIRFCEGRLYPRRLYWTNISKSDIFNDYDLWAFVLNWITCKTLIFWSTVPIVTGSSHFCRFRCNVNFKMPEMGTNYLILLIFVLLRYWEIFSLHYELQFHSGKYHSSWAIRREVISRKSWLYYLKS